MRSRLVRLLALLFALGLFAGACGGGDDGGDTEAGSEEASGGEEGTEEEGEEEGVEEDGGLSQSAVEQAVSGEGDEEEEEMSSDMPDFDVSTMDGIWEREAWNRDQVVAETTAMMESGEWGVGDDNVLRGPEGFEIDLNECPEDWSDTAGLTDSEIRFGQTTVQSGALAAYGNLTLGMQIWFDYINSLDVLGGRDIVMIVKDDEYVAAKTIEFTDELIESENPFMIQGLGSPNGLAVYDKINDECIPHPFYLSGHPAWGDPVNHPWTTSYQMSYSTEAVLWGTWIKVNLADQLPVKVAGLVMDNDFGLAYEEGFKAYAEANPDVVSEFVPVRHDPAAPTVTNEITTIAASGPDVFISMTAGNACLLAVQEAESSGLNEDIEAAFTPSVCKPIAAYMAPAGDAANGWWVVGGGAKDTTDAVKMEEPFIQFVNGLITDAGEDAGISLTGEGTFRGYAFSEALRIADALPGGLSRSNMMLALRNFRIFHPGVLDEVTTELYGNADAYFIEGSEYSQFDAGAQTWNQVGSVVDANGATPNCAWDKQNGGC